MTPVIILGGPTAVGKTEVALHLARQLGAEIISADSRQLYKGLDIGTAKPSAAERAEVPHHFIDMLEPDQSFNAGLFQKKARALIAELEKKGKAVIVCGGTGLYIRALLRGIIPMETDTSGEREQLAAELETRGLAALYHELEEVDPLSAGRIDPADARRITRALEIFRATGKTFSYWLSQPQIPASFPFFYFALERPRPELYDRINRRVEQMLAAGLVEEVRALVERGYAAENALNTVGYKEVMAFLRGELSRDEMTELIKRNTRRYAKRQMTWFRKEPDIIWLEAGRDDLAGEILRHIRKTSSPFRP